jgi:hypothetical protein
MPNACFPIPDGDSAQPVTFVTRSARIDLLFTMSDITRAPAKRTTRGLIFSRTNFGACGAVWWSQTGSNRRPPACKAGALPTELWPRQECGSRRQVSGQRILMPKIPIVDSWSWWAWEDLNFRPHAYQARALTN